jgi:hypothetical protein
MVLLVGAGALVLGFRVGTLAAKPTGAKQLIGKVVRPATGVLAGVALIAVLVYAAQRSGWSEQLWGQIISAIGLATVTYALYGSGGQVPTVRRSFTTEEGETTKTYAVNSALTPNEYSTLKDTHGDDIKCQRGLYFRALYVGADGRWSTSKMQILLWTYAVLFALLAIFIAMQLDSGFDLDLPGDKVGKTFGDLQFHEEYLILLGGYFAAAVLAKGIKTNKVKEGDVSTSTEVNPNPIEGIKNLVSDDAGNGDVGDAQFFLFNVLALTVFFVSFVPHLEKGLPDLPMFLVSLTSLSALAYVGKKAAESSTPNIAAVVPSKVRPGDHLRIEGSYLADGPSSKPTVTIDGAQVAANSVTVVTTSGPLGEESVIRAQVPAEARAGTDKVVAVRPRGANAAATANIEIVEAVIAEGGVDPEPVPWRAGVGLTITGSGFGPDPGAPKRNVKLGDATIGVTEWKDARIVGTLQPASEPPTEDTVILSVARGDTKLVERRTKVGLTAMVVTAPGAEPIVLREGTAVSIVGTGFGPPPGGIVKLNGVRLRVGSWSDVLIVATLGADFPPTEPPPERVELVVERAGYGSGGVQVEVSLPAVAVTDAHPKQLAARAGTPLTVYGSGFGREGPLSARIGEVTLRVVDGGRSETVLQLTVDTVPESVTTAIAAKSLTTQIVVERDGWAVGSKEITLTKPD